MMNDPDDLPVGTGENWKFVSKIIRNLKTSILVGTSGMILYFKIEPMLPEASMGERTGDPLNTGPYPEEGKADREIKMGAKSHYPGLVMEEI